MDQIEKPLSILLIVAAIAYAFMYTDASDGFTAIENNTASGYTIEAAELSTGYNVICRIYTAPKVVLEFINDSIDFEVLGVDSLTENIVDSLNAEIDGMIEAEVEVTTTDEGE